MRATNAQILNVKLRVYASYPPRSCTCTWSRTTSKAGVLRRTLRLAKAEQDRQKNDKAKEDGPLEKSRKEDPLLQDTPRPKRQADSSDWISSQLTRRFGIAGGLVWLAILLFGVVSEQVKTRLENAAEDRGTKDVANAVEKDLGEGLTYKDIRQGGGAQVQQGYLTVLHYKGYANGQLFEDTEERGKPLVYLFGGRPFTAGLCLGTEKGMAGMKAGGIRSIKVPSKLGFGDRGMSLRGTRHVPGKAAQGFVPEHAELEYTISLIRVSIPPS